MPRFSNSAAVFSTLTALTLATPALAWEPVATCDGRKLVVDKERRHGSEGYDVYQLVINNFGLASGLFNVGAVSKDQYENPGTDGVKNVLNGTRGYVELKDIAFDGDSLARLELENTIYPAGGYVST